MNFHISQANHFANDRPHSTSDDLYQWALDAEYIIREMSSYIDELQSRTNVDLINSSVSGALYDFIGWLTSHDQRLILSSTDNASPAVDAIIQFAKMRHLNLDKADVKNWHCIL